MPWELLALLLLPAVDRLTFSWWRGRRYRRIARAAADAALMEGRR